MKNQRRRQTAGYTKSQRHMLTDRYAIVLSCGHTVTRPHEPNLPNLYCRECGHSNYVKDIKLLPEVECQPSR